LLPYAFAAVRMSYGVSWKIALIAEIFGTNRGLGYLMTLARSNFDSRMLFAAVLVVIVLVFAGDRFVFAPIQRRLTAWRAAWGRTDTDALRERRVHFARNLAARDPEAGREDEAGPMRGEC